MNIWGIGVDEACSFCQQEKETRDHVFFGCTFAKSVWERVMQLCGLCRGIGSWDEELKWAVMKIKGKVVVSII